MAFLSSLAEDERERIYRRSNEGQKQARRKAVKFGSKLKLNNTQRNEAMRMIDQDRSVRDVASVFNVSE